MYSQMYPDNCPLRKIAPQLGLGFWSRLGLVLGLGWGNQTIAPEENSTLVRVKVWVKVSLGVGGGGNCPLRGNLENAREKPTKNSREKKRLQPGSTYLPCKVLLGGISLMSTKFLLYFHEKWILKRDRAFEKV